MVVNTGLAIITNRLIGAGTEPNYVGWGTSTQAPAVGDTGLITASAEARVQDASATRLTTNATNDSYQIVASITSASGQTISEVGTFDASTAGNMFSRDTFTGIALSNGESIEFTIKTVFDQA